MTPDSRILLVQGCPERPVHQCLVIAYDLHWLAHCYCLSPRRSIALGLMVCRSTGGVREDQWLAALQRLKS